MGKIEILSTHISSVENMQLSAVKLQLLVTPSLPSQRFEPTTPLLTHQTFLHAFPFTVNHTVQQTHNHGLTTSIQSFSRSLWDGAESNIRAIFYCWTPLTILRPASTEDDTIRDSEFDTHELDLYKLVNYW